MNLPQGKEGEEGGGEDDIEADDDLDDDLDDELNDDGEGEGGEGGEGEKVGVLHCLLEYPPELGTCGIFG